MNSFVALEVSALEVLQGSTMTEFHTLKTAHQHLAVNDSSGFGWCVQ